ncbi:hypothetical protein TrRE_jg12483, partial [Triparma retinervis]
GGGGGGGGEDKLKSRVTFSATNGKNLLAFRNAVYSTVRNAKNQTRTSLQPLVELGKDSRNACFFYGDKFLASSEGPNVSLHLYNLQSSQTKQVAAFQPSPSHSVLALSCLNAASSNLIFTLHSDRSLHLHDVSTSTPYWSVPAASGRRASHSLAVPPLSPNASVPPSMCDLVACSSPDEGGLISLWDVRTSGPAARFKGGHVNRHRTTCRANFSPCMRYISTGSEDGVAAYYDLRMGGKEGGRGGKWGEGRKVKDGGVEEANWSGIFPQKK